MRTPYRRWAGGAAVVLAALMLAPLPAGAAPTNPDDLPRPTPAELSGSVRVLDLSGSVRVWDTQGSVAQVEQVETDDAGTTITLSTDILFTPDSSTLPEGAAKRIAGLLADVPHGAAIRVDGHTDSIRGKVDNQKLSTDRAKAVAEALDSKRPDIRAKVAGHAATQPAEREEPKDPSTRAANRRVEITYGG